jgi:perosamine synthetase
MAHVVLGRTTSTETKGLRHMIAARHAALLGGTTTWGDCLVGLGCLATPGQLLQGPAITEYEHTFARQIGVRYAYSFAHGRVGLYGLLQALEIGSGDEVLLQVPTHIVVPNAIRYTGARPVYVDCQLDTYNMDIKQAERLITPRTKALILQHSFGIPADLDAALALAHEHGLHIIEDCVHSLGATYDGRQAGSFGCAAFFSSEESKTISTTMGGMVVTDDPELAGRVQAFQAKCAWPSSWLVARYIFKLVAYQALTQPRLHRYTREVYEFFGRRHPLPRPTSAAEIRGDRPANYEKRLSNAQAIVGLRQLYRLDANLAHRRAMSAVYATELSRAGFGLPRPPTKADPAFLRYPVWVEDRAAALRATAQCATLGTWFTSVLEEAVSPACGGYESGSCPRAEVAAQHLVNLPTHPRVSPDHAAQIVAALARTRL